MKQRTMKALALTLSVTLGSLTVAAPALADGYYQDQRGHQTAYGDGGDHHARDRNDHYARGDDGHRRGAADYRREERRDWHSGDRGEAYDRGVRHEYRESSNADYVAMAITTGVILSLFASQH